MAGTRTEAGPTLGFTQAYPKVAGGEGSVSKDKKKRILDLESPPE
jgi:hypothetical protein